MLLGLDTSLHHYHHRNHEAADDCPQQKQHNQAYAAYSSTGYGRGKQQPPALGLSSQYHHHEPTFNVDDDGAKQPAAAAGQSPSPWHRMKWTDDMVRLLIMIVYYVGDDASTGAEADQHQPQPPAAAAAAGKGKKAPASAAVGLLLQKKGKWKSASRAMREKGFYVSPQQCEDKFNDLNKRYRRVNVLLGRGTACWVVENQSLLDSMDHLSPKAEEVRKLLNSKHLFFREMCAYHNSGGTACGGGSVPASFSCTCTLPQPVSVQSQQQQHCYHHSPSDLSDKGGYYSSGRLGSLNDMAIPEEDMEKDNYHFQTRRFQRKIVRKVYQKTRHCQSGELNEHCSSIFAIGIDCRPLLSFLLFLLPTATNPKNKCNTNTNTNSNIETETQDICSRNHAINKVV